MLELSEILRQQGYSGSPHFFDLRVDCTLHEVPAQGAWLLRETRSAGLDGVYTFETQLASHPKQWNRRIAVGMAEVTTSGGAAEAEAAARSLHRSVWNLGTVPFLVVALPHQVSLYSGFSYGSPASAGATEQGLLQTINHLRLVRECLADLAAEAIDSGEVWDCKYGQGLRLETRVDRALLRALQALGRRLRQENEISPEACHGLIGKYIYLRYLWDRGILTDAQLNSWGIRREDVFGRRATTTALSQLVDALEHRFNGRIFPLAIGGGGIHDAHVRQVSSAILGDEGDQLHLPFQPYDFKHIPVEMLSVIYEQFLRGDDSEATTPDRREETEDDEPVAEAKAQRSGVVYTPVFLADHVLSEADRIVALEPGMKVLDPACGSGVFLVLAFRLLIERRRQQLGRNLTPPELKDLLTQCIFGIEREASACAVAEFSLLLTLLHYCNPPDLLSRQDFHFPSLRGINILEANFFDVMPSHRDDVAPQAQDSPCCPPVDLVLGNPPWTELSSSQRGPEDEATWRWLAAHAKEKSLRVTGHRVAEAFAQRVPHFLREEQPGRHQGTVALLLPATSLFNAESKPYRQDFFTSKEVLRITNFANLREVLFAKTTEHPAACIVYRPRVEAAEPSDILHMAPLGIDQVGKARSQPWVLTIHSDSISSVTHAEAQCGNSVTWKLALWGTPRDAQALRRLGRMFPESLDDFCRTRTGWVLAQGPELRSGASSPATGSHTRKDLLEQRRLDFRSQTRSLLNFSVPSIALVPNRLPLLRRGHRQGLLLGTPPHVVISRRWFSVLAFSDEPFLVPPAKIGLAAPSEDSDYLRAVSIFLSSSVAAYLLFFNCSEWGVFRRARFVALRDVKNLPVPALSQHQIDELATIQVRVARQELAEWKSWLTEQPRGLFDSDPATLDIGTVLSGLKGKRRREANEKASRIRERLIPQIDDAIFRVLAIPRDLQILIREWRLARLPLDRSATAGQVLRPPTKVELLAYSEEIRLQLDGFVTGRVRHRVTLTHTPQLVECRIEQVAVATSFSVEPAVVRQGNLSIAGLMATLASELRQNLSQWAYVRSCLRFFEGSTIYLYKRARLIDWTRTQAMVDAADIIGTAVASKAE